MKTGFIALILAVCMTATAHAGDWSFHIGAPPPPPPAPVYPYPYGYSYFYITPPTQYFGFSYQKDRHKSHRDEHCRPPRRGHGPHKPRTKYDRM